MIVKCTKCHHEAQATKAKPCDWCGAAMEQIGTDYMDEPGYLTELADVVYDKTIKGCSCGEEDCVATKGPWR